jgi:hypothetical protein
MSVGLFSRGKHESLSWSELKDMDDKSINKLIKDGRIPTEFTSAKVLRKAAKADKKLTERALKGERSIAPLVAGILGDQGSRNHQNIPLKDRVHPAEYRRILEREARRQGLL